MKAMLPAKLWPTSTRCGAELPTAAWAQAASRQAYSCKNTVPPGPHASTCCRDLRKAQLTSCW